MNNAEEPKKVVDLSPRTQPRAEPPGGRLVESVGEVVAKQLRILGDRMFERVDDALFDLAEKAENNAIQTQYFDGMREARKNRASVERRFLDQVRRNLVSFPGKPDAGSQGKPSDTTNQNGLGELSLVGDSELEESLAVSSMISKAQSHLAHSLHAVNQRLSVICGGTRIENSNNPIGPAALCDAFRQSMHGLNTEMRVRLIIYKLFDRYVMSGLEELYSQVNARLVKAGVLPNLRHAIPGQRSRQGVPAQSGMAQADANSSNTAMPANNGDSGFQADFYRLLNQLLVSRHGQGNATGQTSPVDVPLLSPAELLGALSLLQTEAVSDGTDLAASAALEQTMPNGDIGQVKNQLLHQIHRLRGNPRARMSGADEDTIDLVGMLFEFILEDRNLPTEIQVVLARLQIPYLKVAILDRRMFAHVSHPARRLLNALAEAGKSWSADADQDRRLYRKIHSIVDTLLEDFDDDMDIFGRLEQDLAEFLETNHKRAERSEQRVAEATRGREKLQTARRRAATEVLQRVDRHDLPDIIRSVLTRAWANYLVLTLLRQGDTSAEFRSALRFIDDFVWSSLPKTDEQDRIRLRNLLPRMEKSLRHGLATVAFQDHDVENLMGQLNRLYREQLGESPTSTSPADAATPAIPNSVEVIARPEIANDPEAEAQQQAAEAAAEAGESAELAQVRALKVGTWLEFAEGSGEEAAKERAKLSWISPMSGKYLFVNRRGLKVADKTIHQLAQEFAAGTAIVLEELPLFDRALDAIVERLRKTQSERKPEAADAAQTTASSTPPETPVP